MLCYNPFYLAKLLILGILFSTAINAVFVAKPVMLGVLFSISAILAMQAKLLISPLVSATFFSESDSYLSYLVYKADPLVSILFTFATNLPSTFF